MNVQPFVILGASQRATALESLTADIQEWLAQWAGPRACDLPAVLTEIETGDGDDLVEGLRFETADKRWCICAIGADDQQSLALQLLGMAIGVEQRPSGPVMQQFVLASLGDLVRRWIATPDSDDELMPATGQVAGLMPSSSTRPGQGVISFTASIGVAQIVCWLPLEALLPRIGKQHGSRRDAAVAPMSVGRAIGRQRVGLRATIGAVELSLEALSQLRAGDVLRLEKPITAPLTMHLRNADIGFSGYLGRQQDRLAFRVAEKL